MKVLVVVLNYRTPELVVRCLESLKPEVERIGSMHVVVTDNDSGDDSIPLIEGALAANQWDWCTFMPLPRNGGYSYGNNAGVRPFLESNDPPEYVMLLNPDAHVMDGGVSALIEFLDAHPAAGIAGSRVEDGDGAKTNSAFRFPNATTELLLGLQVGFVDRLFRERRLFYELGDEPMQVDWVTGATMMIRKEVFDDVGLLDDSYFLYFEEVDFCLRARRAGWTAHYVPKSIAVHLQAQSTGITDSRAEQRRYPSYWFESRRRFFLKNHGKTSALLADLAFIGGFSTYHVKRAIQRRPYDNPPSFWWDFIRHSTVARGFKL